MHDIIDSGSKFFSYLLMESFTLMWFLKVMVSGFYWLTSVKKFKRFDEVVIWTAKTRPSWHHEVSSKGNWSFHDKTFLEILTILVKQVNGEVTTCIFSSLRILFKHLLVVCLIFKLHLNNSIILNVSLTHRLSSPCIIALRNPIIGKPKYISLNLSPLSPPMLLHSVNHHSNTFIWTMIPKYALISVSLINLAHIMQYQSTRANVFSIKIANLKFKISFPSTDHIITDRLHSVDNTF